MKLLKIKDKECFFLLFTSYILIFIILLFGFRLLNKWNYETSVGAGHYEYTNYAILSYGCEKCLASETIDADGSRAIMQVCSDEEHMDRLQAAMRVLYGQSATTYMMESVQIDGIVGQGYGQYIFSYGGDSFYNIVKGRDLTQEDFEHQDRVALISESIEGAATKKEDGYYIRINNEEYRIVGIYDGSDTCDAAFAYFPENQTDKNAFLEYLAQWSYAGDLWIHMGSFSESVSASAETLVKDLNAIENVACEIYSEGSLMDDGVTDERKMMGLLWVVLLFFCIIIYVQVMGLVVAKRKKDYLIYRICGWKNGSIAKIMFREMLPVMLASFVSVVVLTALYQLFFSDEKWYTISLPGMCALCFFLVGFAYMSIFLILLQLRKVNLSEGVMEL